MGRRKLASARSFIAIFLIALLGNHHLWAEERDAINTIVKCPTSESLRGIYNDLKRISSLFDKRSISHKTMQKIISLSADLARGSASGCEVPDGGFIDKNVQVQLFSATVEVLVVMEEDYETGTLASSFPSRLKNGEVDLRRVTASVYRITRNDGSSYYMIGYPDGTDGEKMSYP